MLYSVTLSPAAPELSTAFCVFQRSTESNSDTASGSKAWHLDAWRQATRRQLYRMVRTQKVTARQLAARGLCRASRTDWLVNKLCVVQSRLFCDADGTEHSLSMSALGRGACSRGREADSRATWAVRQQVCRVYQDCSDCQVERLGSRVPSACVSKPL